MSCIKIRILLICTVFIFTAIESFFSQGTASASWSLTSNGTPTTTGPITAGPMVLGAGVEDVGFGTHCGCQGRQTRHWASTNTFMNTVMAENHYVEFSITANGEDFILENLSFTVNGGFTTNCTGTTTMRVRYSKDPTFATNTWLNDPGIPATELSLGINNNCNTYTFNESYWPAGNPVITNNKWPVEVDDGETLYLRFYILTTHANNTWHATFSDFSIDGIVDCETPNINTSPASGVIDCINPTSTLTGSSSTPGVTYSWEDSNGDPAGTTPSNPSTTVSQGGVYTFIVNNNGCIASEDVVVVEDTNIPDVSILPGEDISCEVSTVTLTANSVTSNVNFSWEDSNGDPAGTTPSNNTTDVDSPDTYTVTVTSTENGCTSQDNSVIIEDFELTEVTITGDTDICEGGDLELEGELIANATYDWTGPDGFTSTSRIITIQEIEPDQEGLYELEVTLGSCSVIEQVDVVLISSPVASGASGGDVCEGETIELFADEVVGGTYEWTGPNGFTSIEQNPEISNATVDATGTYELEVTLNGCVSLVPFTIDVDVDAVPEAIVDFDELELCEGSDILLSAETVLGATYSWTGPNGFTSPDQNPVIPNASLTDSGIYSLLVELGACTSDNTAEIEVSISQEINPQVVDNELEVCLGETVTLEAIFVSGATYEWTGPNGFTSTEQNPEINNVGFDNGGTYTVSFSSGDCTSSNEAIVEVIINDPPIALADAVLREVCEGETIELLAEEVLDATYEWTGPNGFTSTEQNPIITEATLANSGEYILTVFLNGCPSLASSSTTVTVSPVPEATVVFDFIEVCEGEDAQLLAEEVVGGGYEWTGPNGFTSTEQNPIISDVSTDNEGIYNLEVLLGICFSDNVVVELIVHEAPNAEVHADEVEICEGETLQLSATSVPNGTYEWTGPNGFTSTDQQPEILNVGIENAGTYSLNVIEEGCTSLSPASVEVSVIEAPVVEAEETILEVCEGSTVQLNATSQVGATYEWTGPNGFTSTEQNPIITTVGLEAMGTYLVTVSLEGCSSLTSGEVELTVIEAPVASVDDVVVEVCEGTTLVLSAEELPGATYDWIGPDEFSTTEPSISINEVTSSNEGIYQVSITTVDGCSSINPVEVEVTVIAAPIVDLTVNSTDVCFGEDLIILAESITGATYEWEGPNGFISDEQNVEINAVTTDASGTYSLTVNDGTCSSIVPIEVTVEVHNLPTATYTSATGFEYCDYEIPNAIEVNFTGNGPWQLTYDYNGENNTVYSSTSVVTIGNEPGTYTLTFIEDEYCSQSVTEEVTITLIPSPETPDVSIESDTINYCLGEVQDIVINDSDSSINYYWFLTSNSEEVYQEGGVLNPEPTMGDYEYILIAEANECESLPYTFFVSIHPCEIDVPTAFTPNGDGVNDAWEIPNLDVLYPNHTLRVYNRWGAILFEHDASTHGEYNVNPWDGTYKGEMLPTSSYFFVLEFNDGVNGVFNGAVSILHE